MHRIFRQGGDKGEKRGKNFFFLVRREEQDDKGTKKRKSGLGLQIAYYVFFLNNLCNFKHLCINFLISHPGAK